MRERRDLRHLTTDEIERFADASRGPAPGGDRAEHLESCPTCREEVDVLRGLVARISGLERTAPARGFADSVMSRVDLPVPWLERQLARLPRLTPSPGFATAVLARVRLPVPWHERLWRFARRRRVALAAVTTAMVATTGAAAAWVFGAQGVTPAQLVALALGGARDLVVSGLLAAGRLGYDLGLVDAGGSIADRISPTTAIGGLALAGVLGVASLWVMARLLRTRPRPVELARAA